MKEIFKAINEHPWITFFGCVMIIAITHELRGNNKND